MKGELFSVVQIIFDQAYANHFDDQVFIARGAVTISSRMVERLFLELLQTEFVAFLRCLQGRLAAKG